MAAILVYPNIAVYFKLNYFKLIHLQADMLSSFIFTYFAVNHTNLPHTLSFRLRKFKIKDIVSRWLSHFAPLTVVLYLPDSCKCLIQLNRNSSHKPGTNLSVFFFILTFYYMVFKIALFLVLEKKKIIFYFQL